MIKVYLPSKSWSYQNLGADLKCIRLMLRPSTAVEGHTFILLKKGFYAARNKTNAAQGSYKMVMNGWQYHMSLIFQYEIFHTSIKYDEWAPIYNKPSPNKCKSAYISLRLQSGA